MPLVTTVREALLDGDTLGVDGVLLVGEHGDYPSNDIGQMLYPRKELFDQILAAFDVARASVPVFCDKHLSFDFAKAQAMVDNAKRRNVPLLAASSLPISPTSPTIREAADGASIVEAVAVYPQVDSGKIESYGYHSLEVLQHYLERRTGGEAGVASVACIQEADVDAELLARARALCDLKASKFPTRAFLIEHRDGLRSWQVAVDGNPTFAVALRLDDGTILATADDHSTASPRHSNFGALMRLVVDWMHTGIDPWPRERDLLSVGILQAMSQTSPTAGTRVETPHLALPYPTPPIRVGADDWPDAVAARRKGA